MAQSALDDLREDARAFARQHPGLVHSMVFAHGNDLWRAERFGLPPSVDRPRKLIPDEIRAQPKVLDRRGTIGASGAATMLLWGGPSEPDDAGPRWQRLLDRVGRVLDERVPCDLRPNEPKVWPVLHRFAWTAPSPAVSDRFDRRFAWRGRFHNGSTEPGIWIVEDLPLAHFDPEHPREVVAQSAEAASHLNTKDETVQTPSTLTGEWCSTVYPAGDALVAVIDDLLVGGEAEVSGAGDGAAAGAGVGDTEWWPAGSFPTGLHGRLRQATAPGRKTMVVHHKTEGGVKLYAVADVWKWWPDEMRKA